MGNVDAAVPVSALSGVVQAVMVTQGREMDLDTGAVFHPYAPPSTGWCTAVWWFLCGCRRFRADKEVQQLMTEVQVLGDLKHVNFVQPYGARLYPYPIMVMTDLGSRQNLGQWNVRVPIVTGSVSLLHASPAPARVDCASAPPPPTTTTLHWPGPASTPMHPRPTPLC